MRGFDRPQSTMLTLVNSEKRVPANHPIRLIKQLAGVALKELSPLFEQMYSEVGRPSIPPERLLKASLLMALYTVRSERMFCEQLDYNLLFRWFLDLNWDEPGFDHSTFSRNRGRLLEHDVAGEFFRTVVAEARELKLKRLQGYHARHVMIVIDEASGIDPKLIPALEGISASGDVRWLVLGTPTRASGFHYETHSPRNKTFKKFAISAFDTPNLRTPRQFLPGARPFTIDELLKMPDAELDANPWPQLTSRRFVRDKYLDWYVGKQALWQQRILGNFADLRSEALFAIA